MSIVTRANAASRSCIEHSANQPSGRRFAATTRDTDKGDVA
jgi:hypothetical protein